MAGGGTGADVQSGGAAMTQRDREAAVLTLAAPGRKRLDVDDLESLAELANEEPATTLAEMLTPPKLCACGWPAEYHCCGYALCEPHYIFNQRTCKIHPRGLSL